MRKLSMVTAHKAAEKFQGKCLSQLYCGIDAKMIWQCINGHIFEKSLYDVKNRNRWCPNCSRLYVHEEICRFIFNKIFNKKFEKSRNIIPPYELDGYNEEMRLAFEYNGEQHYKKLKKFKDCRNYDDIKLELCKSKNINLIVIPFWEVATYEAAVNFICNALNIPQLKINFNEFTFDPKSYLQEAKLLAKENNGFLISNSYLNSKSPLIWACSHGHTWEASLSSIKQGSWCPFCVGQIVTLEDMHKLARITFGGICLSKNYKGAKKKLKWQCSQGHVWQQTPDKIKSSQNYCPLCRPRKPRELNSLELFINIAQANGGKCLSNNYINSHACLTFSCKFGHIWSTKPYHIKNGSWCKKCRSKKKKQ